MTPEEVKGACIKACESVPTHSTIKYACIDAICRIAIPNEISRLEKIEIAAVAAYTSDTWEGDEWYDKMFALGKALEAG